MVQFRAHLASLIQKIQALHNREPSLQANFREERHLGMLKDPIVNEGKVWFTLPDKIRREIGGKTPSTTVFDGKKMSIYYPNYQQVIPKESQKKISVNRLEFESALRRVSVLSRDKANAVKVSFAAGRMTLFSSNPDYGEATEELPARYEGEALSTGFNARYLLDVLAVMDGEAILLQMDNPLSPCLIQESESPGFKCVVMPIKI